MQGCGYVAMWDASVKRLSRAISRRHARTYSGDGQILSTARSCLQIWTSVLQNCCRYRSRFRRKVSVLPQIGLVDSLAKFLFFIDLHSPSTLVRPTGRSRSGNRGVHADYRSGRLCCNSGYEQLGQRCEQCDDQDRQHSRRLY
jgi:hypothetical protein